MNTQPVPTFYIPLLNKTFDEIYNESISDLDSGYGLLITMQHEPKSISEKYDGWKEKFADNVSIIEELDKVVVDESLPLDMRIIAMGITTTHIFDII